MSKAPPLVERERPGLSATLTGQLRHPYFCQSCGIPGTRGALERWRECDPWDKPTDVVVVLCPKCSKRLINAHPRLYIAMEPNEPHPGTMAICAECRHRDGVACSHPSAKANGGPGVLLTISPPSTVFLCGGSGRGLTRLWMTPARDCKQRELRDDSIQEALEDPHGA